MAKIIEREKIEYEVTLVLSEAESRALAKILEWGADVAADALLKAVSESERPHRMDVVRMLEAMREELPRVNRLGDDARRVFTGKAVAHTKPPEGKTWRLVDQVEGATDQ